MSDVVIRRLTAEDVAAFRALRIEAMTAEPETFGTDIAEEREKTIETSAASLTDNAVFGAYIDGELVGMAGFHRLKPLRERHKARSGACMSAPPAGGGASATPCCGR